MSSFTQTAPWLEAAEHGWSRPDDPERARDLQPGHRTYIEAARLREGLTVEPDPRRFITDYLTQGIESGTVQDRATVVTALQGAGLEVPRQGKDYLTVRDPESGERWRLKGAIYGQDFQRERLENPAGAKERAGKTAGRGADPGRARQALGELAEYRRERARYHRARYPARGRAGRGARAVLAGRDAERERGPHESLAASLQVEDLRRQQGRPVALAEDLQQQLSELERQVELLATDYREIASVLSGE